MNDNVEYHADPDPNEEAAELLHSAALRAEEALHPDESAAEAKRGVLLRIARGLFGFFLIGAGIAMLPLPGPGWVVIIIGLTLLPFLWARRLVIEIRTRVPGVPAEGKIPMRTKVLYAVVLVVATGTVTLFGSTFVTWLTAFGDPDRLFG